MSKITSFREYVNEESKYSLEELKKLTAGMNGSLDVEKQFGEKFDMTKYSKEYQSEFKKGKLTYEGNTNIKKEVLPAVEDITNVFLKTSIEMYNMEDRNTNTIEDSDVIFFGWAPRLSNFVIGIKYYITTPSDEDIEVYGWSYVRMKGNKTDTVEHSKISKDQKTMMKDIQSIDKEILVLIK